MWPGHPAVDGASRRQIVGGTPMPSQASATLRSTAAYDLQPLVIFPPLAFNSGSTRARFTLFCFHLQYFNDSTSNQVSSRAPLHHDGARVLHLGRLAPLDLRLPAEPRFHADAAVADPECISGGVDHRHVLQQSVGRPQIFGGEVPRVLAPGRRARDSGLRIYAAVDLSVADAWDGMGVPPTIWRRGARATSIRASMSPSQPPG